MKYGLIDHNREKNHFIVQVCQFSIRSKYAMLECFYLLDRFDSTIDMRRIRHTSPRVSFP